MASNKKCNTDTCDGSGYWSFLSSPDIINLCPSCAAERECGER